MSRQITFVVPTYNGLDRLQILCSWLWRQNFEGRLLAVVSDQNFSPKSFSNFAFVQFIHAPNTKILEAMRIGFNSVETKYSAYLGDDDLPTLEGVAVCCDFLEQNKEYGSAWGASGYINFLALQERVKAQKNSSLFQYLKVLISARYDNEIDLTHDQFRQRLHTLATHYNVSQFFVTRTALSKRLYGEAWSEISEPYLAERVWCFSHSILAKSKFLPVHFLTRGLGAHRPEQKKLTTGEQKIRWQKCENTIIKVANELSLTQKETSLLVSISCSTDQPKSEGKFLLKRLLFKVCKSYGSRAKFVFRYQIKFPFKLLNWSRARINHKL